MQSIVKNPSEVRITSSKTSGEKTLVKALAAIVNRDGNKKKFYRKITLSSSEPPWI